jgi:hypothetical protein
LRVKNALELVLCFSLMASIALQKNTIVQCVLFFVFTFILLFHRDKSGRTVHFTRELVLFLSILFMNLFPPHGYVYFKIFGYPITEEALSQGLEKGLILLNLILFSRSLTRLGIVLPGRIGKLLSLSFQVFERIMERKRLKNESFFHFFDSLLLDSGSLAEFSPGKIREQGFKPGIIILFAVLSGMNLFFFLPFMN